MAEAKMRRSETTKLEDPRFENGRALLIAGLRTHFSHDAIGQIPALWQRFVPYMSRISKGVEQVAYGVCWNSGDTGVDYLAGMEVSACEGLPAEFVVVSLPSQKYAVFAHRGHVSKINETCTAIFQCLRNAAIKALPEQAMSPVSLSAMAKSSIHTPERAAWKSGFQSNLEDG